MNPRRFMTLTDLGRRVSVPVWVQERWVSRGAAPEKAAFDDPWVQAEVHDVDTASERQIHLTTDGEPGGPPIFQDLDECFFSLTFQRDTDEDDQAPMGHVRRVENNTVVINVRRSETTTVVLGGGVSGTVNADDIEVGLWLQVRGVPADGGQ